MTPTTVYNPPERTGMPVSYEPEWLRLKNAAARKRMLTVALIIAGVIAVVFFLFKK